MVAQLCGQAKDPLQLSLPTSCLIYRSGICISTCKPNLLPAAGLYIPPVSRFLHPSPCFRRPLSTAASIMYPVVIPTISSASTRRDRPLSSPLPVRPLAQSSRPIPTLCPDPAFSRFTGPPSFPPDFPETQSHLLSVSLPFFILPSVLFIQQNP